MKQFITADWHINEKRLEILGRPFDNSEDMLNEFIGLHNELVSPEDEVYVTGDVCRGDKEDLKRVAEFNGKKILIRGNHDKQFDDDVMSEYFDEIIADGDGISVDIEDIPCYITHYPTQGVSNRFNLVGHIHSAFKYQLNTFNIGVDVNHFRPVRLDSIPFHFKAICDFYDDDVWVAYNPINQDWHGKRGKKGSYFDEKKAE